MFTEPAVSLLAHLGRKPLQMSGAGVLMKSEFELPRIVVAVFAVNHFCDF